MIEPLDWEYAGFGDRLFGDICDGVVTILMALIAYLVIDRWLLGSESRFLSDEGPFGAAATWRGLGSCGISPT